MHVQSLKKPLVYYPLLALLYFSILSSLSTGEDLFKEVLYFSIHYTLLQALLIQVNTRVLLSRYNYSSVKYVAFSLATLILFVFFSISVTALCVNYGFLPRPTENATEIPILGLVVLGLVVLGFPFFLSTFFFILVKEREQREKIEALEKLQLKTELDFLKHQINPHFLFNALNSVYTMSFLEDKSTPEKILMLSDMLRYVLYDCNNEKVSVSREISYLNSYIIFQKLKSNDEKNITFELDKFEESIKISPMLLMPFVENCFKHSRIDRDKSAWIKFEIKMADNKLVFFAKNSIPKLDSHNLLISSGGIGLSNVKKRLDILYPDKYTLLVEKSKDEYSVKLMMDVE
ncbi:histidine kinase [Vibrio sp. 99-8-1]|uniref:sensor histidine kinase n=1 Tax=Vibrio sp. 99-8-1 TaxID=2607602 RepID=UPI0014935EAC|nr:histidine kinase [Vibrio sp. 99-8-1]